MRKTVALFHKHSLNVYSYLMGQEHTIQKSVMVDPAYATCRFAVLSKRLEKRKILISYWGCEILFFNICRDEWKGNLY